MRKLVTENFRGEIKRLLPLIKTEQQWEMLRIAFFSSAIDPETGAVIYGVKTIAKACKVEYSNHFNAGRILKNFLSCLPEGVAELILIDGKEWCTNQYEFLGIEETDNKGQLAYSLKFKKIGDGKQRRVKFTWPKEISSLLEAELKDQTKIADKVYFVSGFKRNALKERVYLKEKIESALNEVEILSSEKGKDIAVYMNTLPVNSFTKLIDNADDAIAVINTLPDHIKKAQLNILASVIESPKPVYRPSENGNTDRLYGAGANITNLKKEVRKALTKDWVETDFESLHLAIISKIWNIPVLADYLKSNRGWWNELYTYLGVTSSAKAELKKFTYALVYGMTSRNIIDGLNTSLGNGCGDLFVKHPLVKAILSARLRVIKEANTRGYIKDAYGVRHELCSANILTLLSRQAQSYEQLIISSLYDLARTTTDFSIVLLQHDGVSIKFHSDDRKEYWISKLNEVAQDACQRLDIPSKLVWSSNEVLKDGLNQMEDKKILQNKLSMAITASINPAVIYKDFIDHFKGEKKMLCTRCSCNVEKTGFVIEDSKFNKGPYCSLNCAKSLILQKSGGFLMEDYQNIFSYPILKIV